MDVIDHLIIKMDHYQSLQDSGHFEQLLKSFKWVPKHSMEIQIKAEEKKLREEEEKKLRKKMAAILIAKGMSVEEIEEVSGLSKDEIRELTPMREQAEVK